MLRSIKELLDTYIDYKAALIAASLLGSIVFSINYEHGIMLAMIAAGKQMTYTFFVAGLITRNNNNLAVKFDGAAVSILLAVAISSCLAIGLTFFVHSLKGTPEPFLSTLPTMLIAPPGFLVLAWRARANDSNKQDLKTKNSAASPAGEH